MIELRNLSKQFGTHRVVRDVTFRVEPGEVLGFLGPNGAGKSTTMKMLTGFLPPTSGTALVCGHDILREPDEAKRRLGYLPEGAPLYPDMTPASLLGFIAQTRDLTGSTKRARIDEACSLVDIGGVWRQRIETLSKGFKRRVGLAVALLHDPDVLVLDEPTDGLDPNQKRDVRALIQRMSAGKTIILSTHILEEVEAVCTRSIIIAAGKVLFDGSPTALRERSRTHQAVELRVQGARDARSQLAGLPGVASVDELGEDHYRVLPAGKDPIVRAVTDHAYQAGWQVEHVHVDPGRLDDVFAEITEGQA
ncbi:MAG: ABC transporter ATP-binding protein [Planctomycetota bacterium]|nr:ABC transporter ATP-binding protein [Planctomycetota bacterium]